MSRTEHREWAAGDAEEVRRLFPEEPPKDQDELLAVSLAHYFGYETQQGIPDGTGYWALEPRCVLRTWYRKAGEEKWSCLTCAGGAYAFDSNIRARFLELFCAGRSELNPMRTPK